MDTVAPIYQLSLDEPLIRGLAYAALHPGLRNVLVFDASPVILRSVSQLLAQMLEIVTDCKVVKVQLGAIETDDDIWGQWNLNSQVNSEGIQENIDQPAIFWQPGLLGSKEHEPELRLVVIPDLTQLSLAGMRACISAMDVESLHLERHGKQQRWKPNLCWLVGCAKENIGLVSPHLLDRIALRLTGRIRSSSSAANQKVENLLAWLEDENLNWDQASQVTFQISEEIQERLRAGKALPHYLNAKSFGTDGLEHVITYMTNLNVYSSRREVALARLAVAEALLSNLTGVSASNVDRVASIIGLEQLPYQPKTISDDQESLPQQEDISHDLNTTGNDQENLLPQEQEEELSNSTPELFSEPITLPFTDKVIPKTEPLYAPGTTEVLEPLPIFESEQPGDPYPEDSAPVEREAMSLKLPPRRFRTKVRTQGAIIGVESTGTPQDLALVNTLLEAAKYQSIRHKRSSRVIQMETSVSSIQQNSKQLGKQALILTPADLRCYRRMPVAEQMLALVIDHTCLQDCDWQSGLIPYISWAYQERASVCLVQVGAKLQKRGATAKPIPQTSEIQPEELRASKRVERSILVPSIAEGIEAPAGRATPLAHGLELVLQSIRHALQHGRSTVQRVLLIVISDGRGNVPLNASYSGKITSPVKREGVEDTLKIAEQIGLLDNVEVILLDPQPQHYPNLPSQLAKALGAKTQALSPLEDWDIDNMEVDDA